MKQKTAAWVCTFIALAAMAAAVYFGYRIVEKQLNYLSLEKEIDGIYITMDLAAAEIEPEPGQSPAEFEKERKLIRYNALHEENPDVVGWISIEGTTIHYPVMQTPEDPQYYYHRNFHGEYSSGGMIFMDASCRLDGTSGNLVIYGHHMKNGTMFAPLADYDSKEFWKEHQYMEFSTLDEIGKYQVVAAFKQPAENLDQEFVRILMAQTEEDRTEFLNMVKAVQFYDTGVEVLEGEMLITLATCEYTYDDGRIFVVAKKVEG